MSGNLELVTTRQFDDFNLECYVETGQEDKSNFWATRTQIGQLLGYVEPGIAVGKIHQRNQERLDMFSRVHQIDLPSGGTQLVTLYNFKGLLEICRYSNQPKANDVIDVLWDIADEIRRTGEYSLKKKQEEIITPNVIESAKAVYQLAGYTGNQLVLAVDKYFRSCTGRSALEVAGIQLVAPKPKQLLNPTEIGQQLGISARRVNEILAGAGYQHKIADKWEVLGDGRKYGVMLDTNKKHSDGTPIRQLKWQTDIIPIVEELLEATA